MNRSEKIGKVMLDLSSKTKHLDCLLSKIDRTKKDIKLMCRVLEGEETGYFKDGVFYVYLAPHVMSVDRHITTWPTLEDISNLLFDINTTKEIIDRLEQQLHDFGV